MRGLSLWRESPYVFTQKLGFCTVKISCDTFYQKICQNRITQYDCIIDDLRKFQSLDLREWRIRPIHFIAHSTSFEIVWKLSRFVHFISRSDHRCGWYAIRKLSRQTPSKSSTWDQFKVIQEGNKLIQDCKTMCLVLADGPMTFNTWDHRLSTGPCVKEVSLLGSVGVPEGRQTCFFDISRSHGNIDAHPSLRTDRTERDSIKLKWRRPHNVKSRIGILADLQYCDHDIVWFGSGSLSRKWCQKKSWQYRSRDPMWKIEENLNKEEVLT